MPTITKDGLNQNASYSPTTLELVKNILYTIEEDNGGETFSSFLVWVVSRTTAGALLGK